MNTNLSPAPVAWCSSPKRNRNFCRRFAFGTVSPLALGLTRELAEKYDSPAYRAYGTEIRRRLDSGLDLDGTEVGGVTTEDFCRASRAADLYRAC